MSTIYALASGRGKAGLAVIRLSGPASHDAVSALAGHLPAPRRMVLRKLVWAGNVLDEAMIVIFAEGASFTGEIAAELHVHGGSAVISAVLAALSAMPGLKLAEPGEFTRRALEAGRLDLTQVEGLADLIEAETEQQRLQALRVLSGAIGRRVEGWRSRLLRAAALLEATIDFVDEDVPVDVTPEVTGLLDGLIAELGEEIRGGRIAERVRDGFVVAILGRPNVGKSSLVNILAGREAALVSPVAGTTRDVIEVRMDVAGLAVTFLDTAGLHETLDDVERMGVNRALERARDADLRLFLTDDDGLPESLQPDEGDLVVFAKSDLRADGLGVSGRTGKGVDALLAEVRDRLELRIARASTIIRERHRLSVTRARDALISARAEVFAPGRTEFAATDMRSAMLALDGLVGRIDVEAVLGEIFSSFCIGK